MHRTFFSVLAVLLSSSGCGEELLPVPEPVPMSPPFAGTIFIDPDIITDHDPTAYTSIIYSGQGERTMFDRRVDGWITTDPFLFDATYDDGLAIEVQVNSEFLNRAAAQTVADYYAEAVGRIPKSLRLDVETMWIHKGLELFGGGNNNILIHVDQGDRYIADGILEETLLHEAAHTSLDGRYANSPGWLAAQASDPTFISNYARDFPAREDIAETIVPYVAVQYRPDRISESLTLTIMSAIPNRITFLNSLNLDMHPVN